MAVVESAVAVAVAVAVAGLVAGPEAGPELAAEARPEAGSEPATEVAAEAPPEPAAEAAARRRGALVPAELAGDRLERGHRGGEVLGGDRVGDAAADAVDHAAEALEGGAALVGEHPGAVAGLVGPAALLEAAQVLALAGEPLAGLGGVDVRASAFSSIQSRRVTPSSAKAVSNSREMRASTVRSQKPSGRRSVGMRSSALSGVPSGSGLISGLMSFMGNPFGSRLRRPTGQYMSECMYM